MQPRTLKIVLALSILLNIFVLSAMIGGALWLKARHPMIAAGSLRIAGDELPASERRAFRVVLRDTRRQSQPLVQAGRQARQEAAGLIVQPVVDQAALANALARARAADIALRERIETRAIGFVSTLPPADRQHLADGLLRRADRNTRQPAH